MSKITNIVATAHVSCDLVLTELQTRMPAATYNPRNFSGLLIRTEETHKAHCQIYANGKITINGGRSLDEAGRICELFCERMKLCGYPVIMKDYKIVNIIATLDMGRRLDLRKLSSLPNAFYEPEIFPGMTMFLTGCTAVLFSSGKINFLGARCVSDLHAAEMEKKNLLS